MDITEFQTIANKATAGLIGGQTIHVTDAAAILDVHRNLTESNRRRFMAMPIDDVLNFTKQVLQEQKPSIKQYLRNAATVAPEPEPTTVTPEPEAVSDAPSPARPMVIRETVDAAALKSMSTVVGKTAKMLVESQRAQAQVSETIIGSLDKIGRRLAEPYRLLEAHLPLLEAHTKSIHHLHEVNDHLVALLEKLIAKVDAIAESRPIVNVPAPQVTVAIQEKKNTVKNVERDERGYITRVTEETESDEPA